MRGQLPRRHEALWARIADDPALLVRELFLSQKTDLSAYVGIVGRVVLIKEVQVTRLAPIYHALGSDLQAAPIVIFDMELEAALGDERLAADLAGALVETLVIVGLVVDCGLVPAQVFRSFAAEIANLADKGSFVIVDGFAMVTVSAKLIGHIVTFSATERFQLVVDFIFV